MPISTKLFNRKNHDTKNSDENIPEQNNEDIQINDFSENIDLKGLGDLLGGGIPTGNNLSNNTQAPESPQEPNNTEMPRKTCKKLDSKGINSMLSSVLDKLKGKDKSELENPTENSHPDDKNYVSETVRFVDYNNTPENQPNYPQGGMNPPYPPQNTPQPNSFNAQPNGQATASGAINPNPPQSEPYPPYYGTYEGNTVNNAVYAPVNYNVYGSQPPADISDIPQAPPQNPVAEEDFNLEFEDVPAPPQSDFSGESSDILYETNTPPMEFGASEEMPPAEENQSTYEQADDEYQGHDIRGALRAAMAKLRSRLPGFKPREYTMPEPDYQPQDDNIRPPSLAADIEKMIEKKRDLGEVAKQYDEMRQYVNSVDVNVRLSRDEISNPEKIEEVYAAQNELLTMINQIGVQNEQQRRMIGVYEKKVEDPYNYRGVNNNRQNYSDLDSSSFSMSDGMIFESEEKISPTRYAASNNNYGGYTEEPQFDDDFDNDFDNGYAMPNYGAPQNYNTPPNYDTDQNYNTPPNYGTDQNYSLPPDYGTDQNYNVAPNSSDLVNSELSDDFYDDTPDSNNVGKFNPELELEDDYTASGIGERKKKGMKWRKRQRKR